MKRLSTSALMGLGAELSEPERALLLAVAKLRLASHGQLARLIDDPNSMASQASRARMARRTLARLSDLGLLARLERRVGGMRAGSLGYCYYLGPAGQRLTAYWEGRGLVRGRFRPEPGGRYVRHRLAVSELFVLAWLADRARAVELLTFDVEPDCWRRYLDVYGGQLILKPDAFVRIGVGASEEDRIFVEVDLGSESRMVLARKARAYLDYYASGVEQAAAGAFPRVLLLTSSEARRAAVAELMSRLPEPADRLFAVGLLSDGLRWLAAGGDDPTMPAETAGGAA